MKKHALMLTAATVALMTGSAAATDYSTITTKVTSQVKTSTASASGTASDIKIGTTSGSTTTPGSVVVTTAGPAIEIDSNNSVNSTLAGNNISNTGTTNATGVRLDALSGGNGPGTSGCPGSTCIYAFDNYGAIDLTGGGTGKHGINIALGTAGSTTAISSGTFNGGIHLESGSSLSVTGDGSYGIYMAPNVTMNGNIALDGAITMTASSSSSTTSTTGAVTSVYIGGGLNGDFSVASTSTIAATGAGAQGIVLAGDVPLAGSFTNNGTIATQGYSASTTVTTATSGFPEAGSALIVSNSITGGIYNAGPSIANSSASAVISSASSGPAIQIGPGLGGSTTTAAITIGTYAGSPTAGSSSGYGFVNRGTITAKPTDVDTNVSGIFIAGNSGAPVTIAGGFWNSGAITTTATTDSKAATSVTATAMNIGDYTKIANFYNDSAESNHGTISATVSGDSSVSASATAILIGQYANPGAVMTLTNTGTISASAVTTSTNTSGVAYAAYAINDQSGTLTTINNSGTISAATSIAASTNPLAATTNKQTTVAAYLGNATGNINFTNSGTIYGDITFGNGNDTLTLTGTPTKAATITSGNTSRPAIIDFGLGENNLTMTGQTSVTGTVLATNGKLNVNVGAGSTLTLTNSATGLASGVSPELNVGSNGFTVADGGTVNMTVSQVFNSANATIPGATYDRAMVLSTSGNISLGAASTFNLSYGSFVSGATINSPAQFVLFEAPTGSLTIGNYSAVNTNVTTNLPYLFTGGLCTYNVGGATTSCASQGLTSPTSSTDSQLVLYLEPKTAGQLGLTGNAAKIYDYANAALAKDDPLGGAFVSNIRNQATAQAAYSSFLPDLSDSSRAVAIDITDQATGPVGARQRALRMYAAQPGGATLWGQEFVARNVSGGNLDAYRTNGWGIALGMDEGDPRNGRYGAAITFFSGDQTNKGPNFTKTSNLWYMLSGYTDWRGKGLFFDSQLSFGYGSLTGKRHLQLTDSTGSVVFSRTATGKRPGLLLAAGISTGAVLTYGSTVITPQFSLDGLTMREEGYTESGGGSANSGDGFDLKIHPYYANSLRGYLGTSVRQDLNLGDFYIQPEVRVGYRYDFLADAVKLRGAFASMASTAGNDFTLTGRTPNKGDLVGGLDLAVTTGAWSLGVSYDYLRGSGSATTQAGMVTLVGRI
ncbi:MAG: autotransporter domain-containing protein [Alphaproteobacteria bacterium]|nr:autotransporter domain-containing protein [Alphaproteobacteria bacterium]